jgi:tetratricopeptide (TPR) repeat protein
LNENTIDSKLEQCLKLYNKTINNLSNPIKDTIVDLINQYETRCQALILSRISVKQNKEDIKNLFVKIIKASSNVNDESFLSDKYDHYFSYLRHVKDYHEAVRQINTFLLCCNSIEIKTHWMYQLAMCYKGCGDFSKAIETYKKVLPLLKGLYSAVGKQYALQYAQVCGDYATTMSSIIGNEKNATSVLLESYHVFKDNSLTDSYSFIHVTESLIAAFISIRDIETASNYLDELKETIEACSDNDIPAMASLKLRFVVLKIKLDLFSNKLAASRVSGYVKEANANCMIIQNQANYREIIWEYYITMIYASTLLLLTDGSAVVPNPKFWINQAKIEMIVIKGWYDEDSIFTREIELAFAEINYVVRELMNNDKDDESVLNEKFKHTLIKIVSYIREKHIISAMVLRFMDVALFLGQLNDYSAEVTRLIELYYNESTNLDEFSKNIMDFKIKVYQSLYVNREATTIKKLYDEYKANYSLIQFLNTSFYIFIHADFLNAVVYDVLINDEKYEEALSLINDVLSICDGIDYMDTKAEVLFRMGRQKEAVSVVEGIVKLNPDYYPLGNEYLYNELLKLDEFKKLVV